MRLVEDVGGIPQFKDSLHTQLDMNRAGSSVVKISGASSMTESMDLSVKEEIESDNSFNKVKYFIDEETEEEREIIKPLIFINEESNFVNNIKLDIGNIEDFVE